MQKVAIIIPCYNEEKRIEQDKIAALLQHAAAHVYLCNDGSIDGTATILNSIAAQHPGRCFVIDYKKNSGKANTIYKSVNELLLNNGYSHIAYFDADFSTPAKEAIRMLQWIDKKPQSFIIGSRVLLLNSDIQRKTYRHIIGRFIVTIVNLKFKLGIYDTQCGAKIFSVHIAAVAFSKPFNTSWLFDIEIFIRLQKSGLLKLGKEFPLKEWKDVDGSKLSWKTSFKILKEIYTLYKL